MMKSYFLNGKRIGMRRLSEDDLTEEYFQWLNDPETTRFIDAGYFPNDWESFRSYLETMNRDQSAVFLGIFWKENKKHVGNVKLAPIDWIHRRAEYSILIGNKHYWNMGICLETTYLVCKHAFNTLNLNRIQLGVVTGNHAALTSYRKIGFKDEGVARAYFWSENRYLDNISMGLIKSELRMLEEYE